MLLVVLYIISKTDGSSDITGVSNEINIPEGE